ncbi:MAG TPA: hypothetical protein VEW95_05345 [Candidatus Limnocylindrales bacterium]|nr:hypothetical protein [Candidatus Limnocylindrales bacterium]
MIDRLNAKLVNLPGKCRCPGEPHGKDWAKVRLKSSYGETLELSERLGQSITAALIWWLAIHVIEWTLLDADGKPVEITEQAMYDLEEEDAEFLQEVLEPPDEKKKKKAKPKGTDPPNPSGDPSQKS